MLTWTQYRYLSICNVCLWNEAVSWLIIWSWNVISTGSSPSWLVVFKQIHFIGVWRNWRSWANVFRRNMPNHSSESDHMTVCIGWCASCTVIPKDAACCGCTFSASSWGPADCCWDQHVHGSRGEWWWWGWSIFKILIFRSSSCPVLSSEVLQLAYYAYWNLIWEGILDRSWHHRQVYVHCHHGYKLTSQVL